MSDFLGDYGLATEAFGSPKRVEGAYASYWRGSVWGTEQLIIARGLEKLDRKCEADKIIDNYCNALRKGGAFENSNSLTGEGNCAVSYSWSAAIEFFKDRKLQ